MTSATLNFASDNAYGAPDAILNAVVAAATGTAGSYGADDISRRVEQRFAEVFERDVSVFMVATGTAANAIGLSALVPNYGVILCHREAHIMADECGAVEMYAGGARLFGLEGDGAKISSETLAAHLAQMPSDVVHHMPPAALALTQATECGRIYTCDEIAELSKVAKARDLAVHMDGARFANALVTLNCSPAEMTWKAGVDMVSFGATKNGCLAAEAIVVFDRAQAQDLRFRRKRGGHLFSKSRFMAAQLDAYLEGDLWLSLARDANAKAQKLSRGMAGVPGVRLAWPVEANEVFLVMPRALHGGLLQAGVVHYEWSGAAPQGGMGADDMLVRMVCAFNTPDGDISRAIALAGELGA